ncbi:MAG: hypothetical protein KGQ87_07605 [Verrucomicrobia bacterium]|nr:hypothetical protein [Verrucomicrobiota bacterium]
MKEWCNLILRGWAYYFKAEETKGLFEVVGAWIGKLLRIISCVS